MENAKKTHSGYIKMVFKRPQETRKKQKEIRNIDLKRMTVGFIGAIKRLSFPAWGRVQEARSHQPHDQVKTLRLCSINRDFFQYSGFHQSFGFRFWISI